MKQLIEEQKKHFDRLLPRSVDIISRVGSEFPLCSKQAIWNWHKQSLKQFIDELLVKLEEKIKVIEKRQRDFTNDPLHPFNAHLLGTKDALKGQISHLKELKEELN